MYLWCSMTPFTHTYSIYCTYCRLYQTHQPFQSSWTNVYKSRLIVRVHVPVNLLNVVMCTPMINLVFVDWEWSFKVVCTWYYAQRLTGSCVFWGASQILYAHLLCTQQQNTVVSNVVCHSEVNWVSNFGFSLKLKKQTWSRIAKCNCIILYLSQSWLFN